MAGNDNIATNGGDDVVYAGGGNDTLNANSTDVAGLVARTSHFDGGNGLDTLKLVGGGITLDLTEITSSLTSFENFDITGLGNNTIKLNTADVLALGDFNIFNDTNTSFSGAQNHKQLMVTGNSGDTVNLTDLTSWTHTAATTTYNGHSYDAWTNQNMQLLIDHTVTVS
jgi:hypothetical protein